MRAEPLPPAQVTHVEQLATDSPLIDESDDS